MKDIHAELHAHKNIQVPLNACKATHITIYIYINPRQKNQLFKILQYTFPPPIEVGALSSSESLSEELPESESVKKFYM